MGKTIDDLRAAFEKAQAEKEALKTKIGELERKQDDLKRKAEEAAEAGDVDGYSDLKGQAEHAASEVYVMKKRIQKTDTPISREDAVAAWGSYITPANKEFEKKHKAYLKAKRDLAETFKDMAYALEKSYFMRMECARFAGIPITSNGVNYNLNTDAFPMEDIGSHTLDGEIDGLMRIGAIGKGDRDRITYMINAKLVH